jgi:hypothetical protein
MSPVVFIVAYMLVGFVVAVLSARSEFRDGAVPGSVASAGAVGMFAACFWPLIVLGLLVGWVARLTCHP